MEKQQKHQLDVPQQHIRCNVAVPESSSVDLFALRLSSGKSDSWCDSASHNPLPLLALALS